MEVTDAARTGLIIVVQAPPFVTILKVESDQVLTNQKRKRLTRVREIRSRIQKTSTVIPLPGDRQMIESSDQTEPKSVQQE